MALPHARLHSVQALTGASLLVTVLLPPFPP